MKKKIYTVYKYIFIYKNYPLPRYCISKKTCQEYHNYVSSVTCAVVLIHYVRRCCNNTCTFTYILNLSVPPAK